MRVGRISTSFLYHSPHIASNGVLFFWSLFVRSPSRSALFSVLVLCYAHTHNSGSSAVVYTLEHSTGNIWCVRARPVSFVRARLASRPGRYGTGTGSGSRGEPYKWMCGMFDKCSTTTAAPRSFIFLSACACVSVYSLQLPHRRCDYHF